MTPTEAAQALLGVTEDLGRAIARGDWEGLAQASIAREQRFEALREVAVVGDAALKPILDRVRALDGQIEAAASTALEALRSDLGQLAVGRRAARSYRGLAGPPRFIARHV